MRLPGAAVLRIAGCVALILAAPAAAAQTRKVYIVYSHGTERPQQRENCRADFNRVPPSLTDLESKGLATIVFVCSTSTDDGVTGSYIYKRAREIGRAVDELRAKNVIARDIFLAGHSAGAWASLMYLRDDADRVNGAILFAPACCGVRSEIDQYPVWLRHIQPKQIGEIVSGKPVAALVFAYEDDPFNRPADLSFLSRAFSSVQLIASRCNAGHLTHLKDCRLGDTEDRIRKFIEARQSR